MGFFMRLWPDRLVVHCYEKWGLTFGETLANICLGGTYPRLPRLFRKWEKWEVEYVRRGYRAISLDNLMYYPGREILGLKRDKDEAAKLHSQIYRERFPGGFSSSSCHVVQSAWRRPGETVVGIYSVPSTEDNSEAIVKHDQGR